MEGITVLIAIGFLIGAHKLASRGRRRGGKTPKIKARKKPTCRKAYFYCSADLDLDYINLEET